MSDYSRNMKDSVAHEHRHLAQARKQRWPHKNEVRVKGKNKWTASHKVK